MATSFSSFFYPWLHCLSQVTVVLWVLCKSWGSRLDTKRFQAAAIFLFIAGIWKCLDKPWGLKSASFRSLVSSSGPARRIADGEQELEKYVQQASDFVLSDNPSDWIDRSKQLYEPRMLFIDFVHPYYDRLTKLKSFFVCGAYEDCYYSLQDELNEIFRVLYTRKKMTSYSNDRAEEQNTFHGCCSGPTWIFCFFLLTLAFFLINDAHKVVHDHYYNSIDHIVTVFLLLGTAWLEYMTIKICGCGDPRYLRSVAQQCYGILCPQRKAHHANKIRRFIALQGLAWPILVFGVVPLIQGYHKIGPSTSSTWVEGVHKRCWEL